MEKKIKISCFINTYNSEKYLEKCLDSIKWCDEIIVVDMHSEDATEYIAKKFGAKIYKHEKIGYVEPARKFAIDKCNNEWILNIDSDEILSENAEKIIRKIATSNEVDAVYIPRKNIFFGKVVLHTGWGEIDDSQLRLYKKGSVLISDEIHNGINIIPGKKSLRHNNTLRFLHYNYDTVYQFIEKLNRYTEFETNKKTKGIAKYIFFAFVWEFLYRYFWKKGFLDGWRGLYLSLAMGFYKITVIAKVKSCNE